MIHSPRKAGIGGLFLAKSKRFSCTYMWKWLVKMKSIVTRATGLLRERVNSSFLSGLLNDCLKMLSYIFMVKLYHDE